MMVDQRKEGKKKSKAQVALENLRAEKRQVGHQAQQGKKKKEKNPSRCRVMSCKCVGVYRIEMKQPGLAKSAGRVFFTAISTTTRNLGAEFQDRRLGRGQRYHNPCFAKRKLIGWTCTVCGDFKRE